MQPGRRTPRCRLCSVAPADVADPLARKADAAKTVHRLHHAPQPILQPPWRADERSGAHRTMHAGRMTVAGRCRHRRNRRHWHGALYIGNLRGRRPATQRRVPLIRWAIRCICVDHVFTIRRALVAVCALGNKCPPQARITHAANDTIAPLRHCVTPPRCAPPRCQFDCRCGYPAHGRAACQPACTLSGAPPRLGRERSNRGMDGCVEIKFL